MSVISTSVLTLGYLTLPAASAAGWPGWYLTWKSVWSLRTGPSATTRASSERSSSERNVGMRRREGSPPGVCAVESTLAMFSEVTRMRPAWARSPDAAMAIDFTKSMDYLRAVVVGAAAASGLAADRGFDQPEAAGVELGRGLVVHLVGGNLDHLVLEVDRVAGRT